MPLPCFSGVSGAGCCGAAWVGLDSCALAGRTVYEAAQSSSSDARPAGRTEARKERARMVLKACMWIVLLAVVKILRRWRRGDEVPYEKGTPALALFTMPGRGAKVYADACMKGKRLKRRGVSGQRGRNSGSAAHETFQTGRCVCMVTAHGLFSFT